MYVKLLVAMLIVCWVSIVFMSWNVDKFNFSSIRYKMGLQATFRGHADASDIGTESLTKDSDSAACTDVLKKMTQGHWLPHPMTAGEIEKMRAFHQHVMEKEFEMPKGLQRQDRRCWDATFQGDNSSSGNLRRAKWFRALCDPEGETPCCYRNHCVKAKTELECTCDNCMDSRRRAMDAEYATWQPSDRACGDVSHVMTGGEICDLLKNSTVYVLGDSMTRHVYAALLMAVRQDDVFGALRATTPQDVKSQCAGIYTFTEVVCRHSLDRQVRACDNTTTLLYRDASCFHSIEKAIAPIINQTRSLVVLGYGIHGGFDADRTFAESLLPVLRNRHLWPKMLWVGVHHFGVLKSPYNSRQQNPVVLEYNRRMTELLKPFHVPVFNTYNMTIGVRSFDGAHYGYGVNKVKVQILLHYLKELRSKNQW